MGGGASQQMREGDWACSSCGNINFANQAFCSNPNCGASRVLTDWLCKQCGNNNFADRLNCNMRKCAAPRTDPPPMVVMELVSKGLGQGSKHAGKPNPGGILNNGHGAIGSRGGMDGKGMGGGMGGAMGGSIVGG